MRLRSVLPASGLLLLAGCALMPPGELPGDPVRVDRFAEVDRPLRLHSTFHEERRIVVRDESMLRETWTRIGVEDEVPAIDFDQEVVVVAAMGARQTGGYAILIERAFLHDDTLSVIVRSISPGAGCLVTQAITHPVDAARVPVSDVPVRFVERSEVREC